MSEASPPRPSGAPPVQVTQETYSASLGQDAHGPLVRFSGTISTPHPALVLNPFVDAVHDQVLGKKVSVVRVDLGQLEFCNSSGFKSFIHWIQRIQSVPADKRYKLRFILSPTRKWQRTSLLALSCFAVDAVEIQ